ncbi:MAG: enolase C-terminal domain-like protein [Acetobacteraceae bacterium]
MRVAPHCWGSALSQAATLQLIASLPRSPSGPFGAEPIMFEFDRGENPTRDEFLTTPIAWAHGVVQVPDGPGLGVEVDEQAVRRFALADDWQVP